jgi:hypothetical protein
VSWSRITGNTSPEEEWLIPFAVLDKQTPVTICGAKVTTVVLVCCCTDGSRTAARGLCSRLPSIPVSRRMAQTGLDSGCIREQLGIAGGQGFAWDVRWHGLKSLRENSPFQAKWAMCRPFGTRLTGLILPGTAVPGYGFFRPHSTSSEQALRDLSCLRSEMRLPWAALKAAG